MQLEGYGYQADVDRRVWPYRDWVIEAFNDNLPYDAFITWQLAGDLLPEPTREQRLATTFNRLHRQTNEGGSIEEEFRVEYVSDRVHTFGTAFLGLTLECAHCHDHKYDPITQEEYYELFAFFDDIDECGLYSHFTSAVPTPTLELTTPEQDQRIAELTAQVAKAEAELADLVPSRRGAFSQWRAKSDRQSTIADLVGDYPLDAIEKGALANRADGSKPGKTADDPVVAPGQVGRSILLSGDNDIHLGVTRRARQHKVLWHKHLQLARV